MSQTDPPIRLDQPDPGQPEQVMAIWTETDPANQQSQTGYLVSFRDGRYLRLFSGDQPWEGKGYPIKEEHECFVSWDRLPEDCRRQVLEWLVTHA